MLARILLASALSAAAVCVNATPQSLDATDMWFNPAESGWGLNVIHQGDTLFATLFVYGSDGQPRWYVASDMSGGPADYTGTLRECTGNAFGEAFNPANHSLFLVGHDHEQAVAEVAVPRLVVNSRNLRDLPTAKVLQPFVRVAARIPDYKLEGTVKVGGLSAATRIEVAGDLHQYGGLNGKVVDADEARAAVAVAA